MALFINSDSQQEKEKRRITSAYTLKFYTVFFAYVIFKRFLVFY